jgi:hypothetical protein
MKKAALVVVTACMAMGSAAYAQTDQEMIDRALQGAPAMARMGASVVKWGADGKEVVIKQGTNDMVCWDQSVWPGQRPFSVHCTSKGSMARVDQNREFFYKAGNAADAEKLVQEAEKGGKRVPPEFGAGHYGLAGMDQATARPHVTIAVPFATPESMKLPAKPSASGAWLMDAGTSGAHIMIPGH